MTTRSKRSTNYTRYTHVQLGTIAHQWQSQLATFKKMPTWKFVNGKSVAQHQVNIARELKTIARYLRSKTVQQINAKIKTLKTQMANRLGVKVSSTKANTAAVKRLKAKVSQIQRCTRVSTLITICTGIKWSSYKNPKVSGTTRRRISGTRRTTATRRRSTRRTAARRSTYARRSSTAATKYVTAKFKRQAQTLKNEIRKLKLRNSFMKRLVAKFRNEVARMKRHYNTLNSKPRLRVITNKNVGKQVSNIVRFSNALSNAFAKQRKAG